MALVAPAGAIEVGLALSRIACDDILERICGAMAGGISLHVEPRDEIGDLWLRQIRFGHTLVGTAVAQDRRYEDALFIGQNDDGADKIGGAWISTCRVAMA